MSPHKKPPSLWKTKSTSCDKKPRQSNTNTFNHILLRSRYLKHNELLLPLLSSSSSLLSSDSTSARSSSWFESKRSSSSLSLSWCARVDRLTRHLSRSSISGSSKNNVRPKLNTSCSTSSLHSVIDVYLQDDDYIDDECASPRRSQNLRRKSKGFDNEICVEV